MVKNHKAKIDARNEGGKYTAALAKVVSEGSKYVSPEIPERLISITGEPRTLADLYVSAVMGFYDVHDTVERAYYDEVYADGLEGMSLKEIVLEHSYFKHDDIALEEIPEPPTSAQLVEVYGSWNAVVVACEMKAFNGYLVAFTETFGKGVVCEDLDDGAEDWPRWVGAVQGAYYELDPEEEIQKRIKAALEYSDMAYAISEGREPDKAVLVRWQGKAEQWMGEEAMPTEFQLSVLKVARKYLTPYLVG